MNGNGDEGYSKYVVSAKKRSLISMEIRNGRWSSNSSIRFIDLMDSD